MEAQQRIFLSFCATALAGVLLCAAYLTSRAAGDPPLRIIPALAATVQTADTRPARHETAPSGDNYLQMAALDRDRAEVFTAVLRGKGFRTVIADGPAEGVLRVLIGPLRDSAALAQTQADLKVMGFTSFPRRQRVQ